MIQVDKTDVYFLDASLEEEAAAPSHLFLAFSFPDPSKSSEPKLCGMRFQGPGELKLDLMGRLIQVRILSLVLTSGHWLTWIFSGRMG